MEVFQNINELEENQVLSRKMIFLVAPNGMIITFHMEELLIVVKFLKLLDTIDSNLSDVSDIWFYDVFKSDGEKLKNFRYMDTKVSNLKDLMQLAEKFPFGFLPEYFKLENWYDIWFW